MKRYQLGSLTVEAAIGIPIFMLAVFTWIEICLAIYSISMSDHALTQAVAVTKKTLTGGSSTKYSTMLENKLREQAGYLWSHVIKPGSFKLDVEYLPSYNDLVSCSKPDMNRRSNANACSNSDNNPSDKAIAIYSLGYVYKPAVSLWFPELSIHREIIAVQEHERTQYRVR